MARLPRVAIADVAHHVTQRGNGRQFILATDPERMVYMDLLRQAVAVHGLSVVGYCLMSNHVHLGGWRRPSEACDFVKYQAGATFFMHTNPLGSAGLITSGANSNVQEELFYPWGQQWATWQPWGGLYSGLSKLSF